MCSSAPGYVGFVAGVSTTSAGHDTTLWTDEAGGGTLGGIWQGGNGLVTDGKSIYISTGNGTPPAPGALDNSSPGNVGQSIVRLDIDPGTGALSTGDFFSPGNADVSAAADHDLGSAGPIALPFGTAKYPHVLATADKDATVFLLNQDSLGGRSSTNDPVTNTTALFASDHNLVANPPNTTQHGLWGHMAAFAGKLPDGSAADYVYYPGVGWGSTAGILQVLKFVDSDPNNSNKPSLVNIGTSSETFSYGSGSPVITSNGTDATSAVVWMINAALNTTTKVTTGTLEAFSALPVPDPGNNNKPTLNKIWQSASSALPASSRPSRPTTGTCTRPARTTAPRPPRPAPPPSRTRTTPTPTASASASCTDSASRARRSPPPPRRPASARCR